MNDLKKKILLSLAQRGIGNSIIKKLDEFGVTF